MVDGSERPESDGDRYPGTPTWVKVIGIALAVVVVLMIVMMLTGLGGPHNPMRHFSHGSPGPTP